MATKRSAPRKASAADVPQILSWLERKGSRKNREGMARYGIVAPKVFGISVGTLREYAKQLGRSHELALALWETGYYEARLLAAFVDEPELVTASQMNAWCKDFDNWAVCDTVCFHLFDRSPLAFGKVKAWASRRPEFEKRAAFALLASLALHDKTAADARFLPSFELMARAADDERNFVKKAVSWALKGVGQRSPELHERAVALARKLAAQDERTRRWVGRDALSDLVSPKTMARLQRKLKKAPAKKTTGKKKP